MDECVSKAININHLRAHCDGFIAAVNIIFASCALHIVGVCGSSMNSQIALVYKVSHVPQNCAFLSLSLLPYSALFHDVIDTYCSFKISLSHTHFALFILGMSLKEENSMTSCDTSLFLH